MSFKDNYLLSGKTFAEWSLENTTEAGFKANRNQIAHFQNLLKKKFDEGIQKINQGQLFASAAIQSEIAYQTNQLSKQINSSSDDIKSEIVASSDKIVSSIQNMCDYLGGSLIEIRWALERNTVASEKILQVLLRSLDNESRQYYEQGVKCYETGEYELAKERFNKALQANRTNYFAYQYLGFIAVFENKADDALRNFDLAYKFAESNYHKALALSHLAKGYNANNEIENSIKYALVATNLQPDSSKYWYELAGYYAKTELWEKCIGALKKAINLDINYWSIVAIDENFNAVRDHVNSLLEELRENEKAKAQNAIDRLYKAKDTAFSVGYKEDTSENIEIMDNLNQLFNENNIFTYKELIPKANNLHDVYFKIAESLVREQIIDIKEEISSIERLKSQEINEQLEPINKLKNKRFKHNEWDAGCGSLILLYLIYGAIAMSIGNSIQDDYEEIATILIISMFIVPALIPKIVNKIKYYYEVTLSEAQNEVAISKLQIEIEPVVKEIERKYMAALGKYHEKSDQLEKQLNKILKKEYF